MTPAPTAAASPAVLDSEKTCSSFADAYTGQLPNKCSRARAVTLQAAIDAQRSLPQQRTLRPAPSKHKPSQPLCEALERPHSIPASAPLSTGAPDVSGFRARSGLISQGSVRQRTWNSATGLLRQKHFRRNNNSGYEPSGASKLEDAPLSPAPQPGLRRSRQVGRRAESDDEDVNGDNLDVPSKGSYPMSRTWSSTLTSTSSATLPARQMLQWVIEVMPRASRGLRNAPFMVWLQAFFKLSYDQYESDDTSFAEAAEEVAAVTDLPANTEPHHVASTVAVGTSGSASGFVMPRAAAAAAGDSAAAMSAPSTTSTGGGRTGNNTGRVLGLHRAGSVWIRGAEAAAVAFGAAFGDGSGLVVDVGMQPTVGNVLRLVFTSIVHPNSMFKVAWDFIYMPINMWTTLVTPVLVVFVTNLRLYRPLGRVEFSLDLLCLLDLSMHLRTAIISSDFHVRTSRGAILRRYFRWWGLLDLLACVPFLTLINIGPPDDYSVKVLLFRLLRLTKLLRLPHLIKSTNTIPYIHAKLITNKALMTLLLLLCAVLSTVHHFACYFYFLGVVATNNTMTTVPPVVEDGVVMPQSWVEAEDLAIMNDYQRYMVAMYWAMYTFLTVGYGDVAIINVSEQIWAILTAITGVVMSGWFMGAVGAYMGGAGGAEAELQQHRQDVFQFIQKRRLGGAVANRVQRYTDAVVWRQLNDHEREVINGLPRMLRAEVVLHINRSTVQSIRFMQTRPPQFVVELLLKLQIRLYDKGEYVIREGEIGTELYFVTAGMLQIRREVPDPSKQQADGAGGEDDAARAGGRPRSRRAPVRRIARTALRGLSSALRPPGSGGGGGSRGSKSLGLTEHKSGSGGGAKGTGAGTGAAGGGNGGGGEGSGGGDGAKDTSGANGEGGSALASLVGSNGGNSGGDATGGGGPGRRGSTYSLGPGLGTPAVMVAVNPDAGGGVGGDAPGTGAPSRGDTPHGAAPVPPALTSLPQPPLPQAAPPAAPVLPPDANASAAGGLPSAHVAIGGRGSRGGANGGGGVGARLPLPPSSSYPISLSIAPAATAPGSEIDPHCPPGGGGGSRPPGGTTAAVTATGMATGPGGAAAGAKGPGKEPAKAGASGAAGVAARRKKGSDPLTRLVGGAPRLQHPANHSASRPDFMATHRVLGTVRAGGYIGYVSCSTGEARLNSVVAVVASELLVLGKSDLEELVAEWPDIFGDPELQPSLARRNSACLHDPLPPLQRAQSQAASLSPNGWLPSPPPHALSMPLQHTHPYAGGSVGSSAAAAAGCPSPGGQLLSPSLSTSGRYPYLDPPMQQQQLHHHLQSLQQPALFPTLETLPEVLEGATQLGTEITPRDAAC